MDQHVEFVPDKEGRSCTKYVRRVGSIESFPLIWRCEATQQHLLPILYYTEPPPAAGGCIPLGM